MKTEDTSCPVCGASRATPLFKREDLSLQICPHKFSIVRCKNCGMGYIKDRPDEKSLSLFYPKEFYEGNHALYKDGTALRRKLEFVNRRAASLRGTGKRILDIGCAGGEFVMYASEKGWDAFGYEWSPIPAASAAGNIIQARTLKNIFPPASFDAVTAWAVLEHAYNLRELMKETGALLKKGGLFIALASNLNSIPGRYMRQDDIPRHLNLFTRKSMTLLCREHGLEPVHWSFHDDIFYSGSHRGFLVFLLKRIAGEPLDDIVAQHRAPGRRHEFCGCLRGKPSALVKAVCAFDRELFTPAIDFLAEKLGYGFTMTVTAIKK